MDAAIWMVYPVPLSTVGGSVLVVFSMDRREALRMNKQICVRTPKAPRLASGAWFFGFGGQREQESGTWPGVGDGPQPAAV